MFINALVLLRLVNGRMFSVKILLRHLHTHLLFLSYTACVPIFLHLLINNCISKFIKKTMILFYYKALLVWL